MSWVVAGFIGAAVSGASAAPSLSVGVANGAPTASVSVPVEFANDGSVAALQFDVYYDPDKLKSGEPAAGPALGSHGLSSALIAPGRRRVVIGPPPDNAVLTSGQVVRLPFTVRADAAAASRGLTVSRVVMSDAASGNILPERVTNGLIADPRDTGDDQDRDGMPDSWEIRYGLNPFDRADATADANGNGVVNLSEFRRGTNPLAVASVPGRLYLSGHGSGGAPRILVVDPATKAEVASIPMVDDPQGLVAHPDGSTVYGVVGTGLSVIDVDSNTEINHLTAVTGTYDVVRLLEDIAISPDGARLYLVYRRMPRLTLRIKVFDTSEPAEPSLRSVIDDPAFDGCYGPLGLGVSPDAGKLYLACRPASPALPDRFYVVDTAGGSVSLTATFKRDKSNYTFINGLTVSPRGRQVYLARTDSDGSTVEVFDGDTGKRSASIALPPHALPRRPVFSPDGARLYVVDQRLGTHVIDTATGSLVTTMSAARSRGVDVDISGDGSHLYAAAVFGVFVLESAANRWSSTITGDFDHVFHIAITPPR